MISPIAEALRDPYMVSPNLPATEVAGTRVAAMLPQIQRARIQSELDARSGKQLIIVHYAYRQIPMQEWVYNRADIDDAHVIWARDMGYLKNRELLNYYPDRQAWYVDRGDPVSLVLPYDQVMAPIKMAFDDAALQTDSSRDASAGHQLSPVITKAVSARPAEIVAPAIPAKAKL
jgi:hypothetical protein